MQFKELDHTTKEIIDRVLEAATRENASDVFFKVGHPPVLKIRKHLVPVSCDPFTQEQVESFVGSIIPKRFVEKYREYEDANFVHSHPGLGRFRVNLYREMGKTAMVFRRIENKIPDFESIRMPAVLANLALNERGLILVTGPTGSGKSTTLAAMIGFRKARRAEHIVTIEDPVEYVYEDEGLCLISQREIGADVPSFQEALESALRQAPATILVGEMRDQGSVESAVYMAETGHLVLTTLHANNTFQAVERILQFFPEDIAPALRKQLSVNLRAIVSQRLIPSTDNRLVPAVEVMINNARMSELIEKGELKTMHRELDQFHQEGMQSFDTSLIELFQQGLITSEQAVMYSDNGNNMQLKLKQLTPI